MKPFSQLILIYALFSAPAFGDELKQNTQYLLFTPKIRVIEIAQMGSLPILFKENLLERFAKDIIETELAKNLNVHFVDIDEIYRHSNDMTQATELLWQIMRVIRRNYNPENDDSIFEDHAPHLTIGAAFRNIKVNGHSITHGLVYSIAQSYFYDSLTSNTYDGLLGNGYSISICIIELNSGNIESCRLYTAEDESLFKNNIVFKQAEFKKILTELVTDSEYVVYEE